MDDASRLRWVPWRSVLAVIVYGCSGLIANWPTWPGDSNRIRAGDLDQMVWFLGWTPYALLHGHNLFFTTALNYPQGVNLAQNTLSPLLGLVTAPLTLLVSPIASLNLLLWAAFPLSAVSAFFVLRRWVHWEVAAFLGGALYGFSPYVVAESRDHLNLAFVPLPPLILLCIYELLRAGHERPRRWAVALGVLVAAQFFVSPEIAATTIIVAFVAVLLLAISKPRDVGPALRRAIRGLSVAVFIFGVAVAYPAWVMLAGPYRYRGPAYPGGINGDLLGPVLPTTMQRFAPGSLAAEGSKLLFGNVSENGAYLGLPLLLLLAIFVVLAWRRPWIRFAAAMVVATTVLTLGSRLVIDNHVTTIPLPFDLLARLPLANNIIAVRFTLYAALFAAFLLALGLDEMHARLVALSDKPSRSPVRRLLGLGAVASLVVLCILSLVPRWPFPTAPASVPDYFTSSAADRIPAGDIVLISPYPSVAQVQPQLWQSVAGMRFSIIGGYALFKGPRGTSDNFPAVLQPDDVQRFLWAQASGGTPYPPGPIPELNSRLVCDLRAFLRMHNVGTVLSTTVGAHPDAVTTVFIQALGKPSSENGGVTAWYHIQQTITRHPAAICGST